MALAKSTEVCVNLSMDIENETPSLSHGLSRPPQPGRLAQNLSPQKTCEANNVLWVYDIYPKKKLLTP